jgi:hypothetical protein
MALKFKAEEAVTTLTETVPKEVKDYYVGVEYHHNDGVQLLLPFPGWWCWDACQEAGKHVAWCGDSSWN